MILFLLRGVCSGTDSLHEIEPIASCICWRSESHDELRPSRKQEEIDDLDGPLGAAKILQTGRTAEKELT